LRIADKKETAMQYLIPYTTQTIIETLLDEKAKAKKTAKANG